MERKPEVVPELRGGKEGLSVADAAGRGEFTFGFRR